MTFILAEMSLDLLSLPLFTEAHEKALREIPVTEESERMLSVVKTANLAISSLTGLAANSALTVMKKSAAELKLKLDEANSREIYPLFERIQNGLDEAIDLTKECFEILNKRILSLSCIIGASVEHEIGPLCYKVNFVDPLHIESPSPTLGRSANTSPHADRHSPFTTKDRRPPKEDA